MDADTYAANFVFDLEAADLVKPRGAQDDDGMLGASSFGCREQMRRTLIQAPKTDSPTRLPALIGSYCDAGFKEARGIANPRLLLAEELPCVLPNGHKILVHPDEIDQDEPSVTDYKTKAGLTAIRRGFVDQRYRFQRHLQYFAAYQAGLVPEQGITRNVFIDRSGRDSAAHVEQEPFDMAVVREATEFLDDALYAAQHNEEAQKDTPRHVCKDYCPWFTACRGQEIELPEITDPKLVALIAAYDEAKRNEKESKALAEELREAGVDGLTGRTATHTVVTTQVNPVGKRPYSKVTVERVA